MGKKLTIRKLADKSEGERIPTVVNGENRLVNPETPGDDHEPWPLAGVAVVGEAPDELDVPQDYAIAANREGWATLHDMVVVYRQKSNDIEMEPHTFVHASKFVIHTIDGDVTYVITHQPDKYVDGAEDDAPMTSEDFDAGNTRVDHFYKMKLEA